MNIVERHGRGTAWGIPAKYYREVAALYDVATPTVSSIHSGKSWGWLNG